MATSTTISKLDMAEINSGIKAALALTDNKAACAALAPIAESLIEGYGKNQYPQYITPALTVIERIAARSDPREVSALCVPLYNRAYVGDLDHLVYSSVLRSLGHLCANDPSAWPLREIAHLIETNRHSLAIRRNGDLANNLCKIAVGIAKASAQAGDQRLRDRADLYIIAIESQQNNDLKKETAVETRADAKKALDNGSTAIEGISALLSISIRLFNTDTLIKCGFGHDLSHTTDTYFDALEGWRAKYTGKEAQFPEGKPRDVLLKELRLGYFWFCTLEKLPPQYATQQDHAKQMAKWLADAQGEAPATAWSVARDNAPPAIGDIFERLTTLQSGGAANGNTPHAKRSSSYALS